MNYYNAWNSSVISAFTVRPNECDVNNVISGEIQKCESDFIIVKISVGFEDLLFLNTNKEQFFDINFCINRTVFQLQHNALRWLKEHKLYSILINNPRYEFNDKFSPQINENNFR